MNLHHKLSLPVIEARPRAMDYYGNRTDALTDEETNFDRDYQHGRQPSVGLSHYTQRHLASGASIAGTYCEPFQPLYSTDNLHNAPYASTPTSRLPSIGGLPLSPLDMESLHLSLPVQGTHERRLPRPYNHADMPQAYLHSHGSMPDIKTLHIHGVHSRSAMPWSASENASPVGDAYTNPSPNTGDAQPTTSIHYGTMASSTGPGFGYQFSLPPAHGAYSSANTSSISSSGANPAEASSYHRAANSRSIGLPSVPVTNHRLPTYNTLRHPLPRITTAGTLSQGPTDIPEYKSASFNKSPGDSSDDDAYSNMGPHSAPLGTTTYNTTFNTSPSYVPSLRHSQSSYTTVNTNYNRRSSHERQPAYREVTPRLPAASLSMTS